MAGVACRWNTALAAILIGAGCRSNRTSDRRTPAPEVTVRYAAPLFDPHLASSMLEGPERDQWQKPAELVRRLRLRPGDTVADVGAGSGYLLSHLSRAVGKDGKVIAEEIQKEYLPQLRKRAARLGNVTVVLGTANDPRLPAGAVDCQVLLTVYHEVRDAVPFLKTLRSAARPAASGGPGRLAIIDFDANRHGTPPAPIGHEVPEAVVIREARAAGWKLTDRSDLFSSQFFLIFTPEGSGG